MYGGKGRLWQDDPEYHLGHQPFPPVREESSIDRYGQSPVLGLQKAEPRSWTGRFDRNADISVERATVQTLEPLIKKYYGTVDFIIVDFPGNLNEEMVRGLLYVEHIFIPFFLDELEIDSTAVFYKTLQRNYLWNENRVLRSVNLFFNRYELVKVNKFDAVRRTLAKAGMPMMEQVVMERTVYRERYRNTLIPIPPTKENGELGLKRFMEEVMRISKN